MSWKIEHSQQKAMPRIDLTRLKEYTEEEWSELVMRIMFYDEFQGAYRDYTDSTNFRVFRPKRVCRSARESGMTMLRTLNFIQ